MNTTNTTPNFNPVARAYRWLEYLSFAGALERCRFHFLPALANYEATLDTFPHRALAYGDGDGRFLARLLTLYPSLEADAVDASSTMLTLLQKRCPRATVHLADARIFTPPHADYDLIVTHFFLDCLTDAEAAALAVRVAGYTRPGALWLVSDFHLPQHSPLNLPARALVRLLYLAFRLLTGLRPTHLPDHAAALAQAGFQRVAQQASLGGILISELWQRDSSEPELELEPEPELELEPEYQPIPDAVPNPEPEVPASPEPDPGIYHPGVP